MRFRAGDVVEAVGKISSWPQEGQVGVYVRKARLGGHVIRVPHFGQTRNMRILRIRHVDADALPRAREYLARWGLVGGEEEKGS